jgi:hypothetical protein
VDAARIRRASIAALRAAGSARPDTSRLAGGGRGARPDSTNADSTGGGAARGGGGFSTWDHGIGGCESGLHASRSHRSNIVWAKLLRERRSRATIIAPSARDR